MSSNPYLLQVFTAVRTTALRGLPWEKLWAAGSPALAAYNALTFNLLDADESIEKYDEAIRLMVQAEKDARLRARGN